VSKHILNIRAINDETGEVGVIHVTCKTRVEATNLAHDLYNDGLDPADIAYVIAPDNWECADHGDDALCAAFPITKAMVH
jgi:hypothetical protein